MAVALSKDITHRADLASLCNDRGLIHQAVEVGTDRGTYAWKFLNKWKGATLWCVDPWQTAMEDYRDFFAWPREPDMLQTIATLSYHHPGRFRILRVRSWEAAEILKGINLVLGFVYIDGNHAYDYIRDDIANWWPILAAGGILAGHDYSRDGVCRAVNEFAVSKCLSVFLTHEKHNMSWYVEKPKGDK